MSPRLISCRKSKAEKMSTTLSFHNSEIFYVVKCSVRTEIQQNGLATHLPSVVYHYPYVHRYQLVKKIPKQRQFKGIIFLFVLLLTTSFYLDHYNWRIHSSKRLSIKDFGAATKYIQKVYNSRSAAALFFNHFSSLNLSQTPRQLEKGGAYIF